MFYMYYLKCPNRHFVNWEKRWMGYILGKLGQKRPIDKTFYRMTGKNMGHLI